MHPSGGSSVQFFLVAKVFQLLAGHLAVILTDELKHNFFSLQHSILGSMIDKLLDALVYSLLLILGRNSVVPQKVT